MAARGLTRFRRPAAIGLLVALGGAAVWFGGPALLRHVSFFRVRRVELVGVTSSKPDVVVRAMRLPARGNVFDDLRPYAARVLALPGIRSAEIHRRLPGTLVVEVREAAAVALAPREGRLAMVGRNGKFLAFDPAVSAPDLPLVDKPDPVVAKALGRLQDIDPELFSRITTASQVRGDVVLDLGGRRLWLRPDVTAEDIRAVTAAEQVLGRQGRAWAELDGRFEGQVVVRWRAG
jgi:cell division septal protein FtsQ